MIVLSVCGPYKVVKYRTILYLKYFVDPTFLPGLLYVIYKKIASY